MPTALAQPLTDAPANPEDDVRAVAQLAAARRRMLGEIEKRVVGQQAVIDQLLVGLFAGGHCLFVGVPGLAKTLLVSTLAELLELRFSRIQFTPDLMPSDITGTEVLEEDRSTGRRAFRFVAGPLFANLVLADEINRTPPKTQAALLQAMAEHRVTAGGRTHVLPGPFLVFATQNPIEQEGTYPLPEAQLDRFLFKLQVSYPTAEQEQEVLARHDRGLDPHDIAAAGVRPVASPADLVALVRATRESPSVTLGVSPRGATALLHASKAWAWLAGRDYVTPDEVKAVVKPALRHRILVRPELELEGTTADGILDGILASVPAPR